MHSIDFHAHHSPLGAYATFTCGRFAAGGGMTIEGCKPATHDLVIGFAEADGTVHALPFYTGAAVNLDNFFEESKVPQNAHRRPLLKSLKRDYGAGTDTWTSGPFSFRINTPVWDLPDPEAAGEAALQRVALPVVTATLRLDNRASRKPRTLVFAVAPGTVCRHIPGISGGLAVGWGRELAVAGRARKGLSSWVHWSERDFLRERRSHTLGSSCGLCLDVPAGKVGELEIVLGFCRPGTATTGLDTAYYYTRAHPTLESVVDAGLARFAEFAERAAVMDRELARSRLDDHQRFLVAHAQRSYWGNTQLLAHGGKPLWVVLEGEYGMINTFDLTVDMCFYELRRNPWTVRNVLDQFVERYAFVDTLARPAPGARRIKHEFSRDPLRLGEFLPPPGETGLPGGLSFCHDMGVGGHFMPAGTSSYETSLMSGCFSHMTSEQLLNWILTAVSYVVAAKDRAWLARRASVFQACMQSLLNRDDPVPERRNGVVGLDSDRCAGGWEITTYDSLDPSLGQARNNLYMATKGWAAWLGLARVFGLLGDGAARREALLGAERAAATIVGQFDEHLGWIPAVFEGGSESAIIPAIEGLVFPLVWGDARALAADGPYGALIAALGRHLRAVLRPGRCLFKDGGWKLSSTSDNSWVSKIFISQHVAERVFGVTPAARSHAAHAHWQQIGSRDWAMSDQCIAGEGKQSKYYPRCVTADLWLD